MSSEESWLRNRSFALVILLLFSAFVFAFCSPLHGRPEREEELTGSLLTDLELDAAEEGSDFLGYDVTLNLQYSLAETTFESTSTFQDEFTRFFDTQSGFSQQLFEMRSRLSIFDFDSTLSFYPPENRMEYWLTETSLTFAGATVQSTFLLEYTLGFDIPGGGFVDYPAEYGAGLELSLSGDIPGGGSVDISSRFGMEEDEEEILGLERGSGYDIAQEGPGGKWAYGTSSLHYVSTTVDFYDLGFGCCQFDTTTTFSRENGFESTTVDFTMDLKPWPLSLETELAFSAQTKSVTLDPYIAVSGDCFDVYLDLVNTDVHEYRMAVEGFGLEGVKVGPVTFSTITALGDNLYKDSGVDDIKLGASDYVIAPDETTGYELTGYDEILSFRTKKGGNGSYPAYTIGADIYFNMDESDALFDTAQFTGHGTYSPDPQFEMGMGIAVEPDASPRLLFECNVYF